MSSTDIPLLEQLLRGAAARFRGQPYQKEDIDMDCEQAVRLTLEWLLWNAKEIIERWRAGDLVFELMSQLRLEVLEDEDYREQFNRVVHAAVKRLLIRIPDYLETSLWRERELMYEDMDHHPEQYEGWEPPKYVPADPHEVYLDSPWCRR